MKKIMVVFGTRPEAIKMCPLVKELRGRVNFEVTVCVTGQHQQMLQQVLTAFNVIPDYNLSIMRDRQTLFDTTTAILNGIQTILETIHPDIVLVHGDTTTTFAVALACFYMKVPVGHVEAGLRTHNIYSPYPEEFNREAVSIIAAYNFAPTQAAKSNLIREGRSPASVWVTGNTGIDALKTTVSTKYISSWKDWAKGNRICVLTAHRRENLGLPMHDMFKAIWQVIDEHTDCKIIYPVHMNPQVREVAKQELGGDSKIKLIDPLDVVDFHNLLAQCYLVLTDSGGIQEEASALGKPVLVMRDTTERPEGIATGALKLVGTKRESIYSNFTQLLDNQSVYKKMSTATNVYGDGHACERIADVLQEGTCQEFEINLQA